MDFLNDVLVWLNDPGNWRGSRGIIARLLEHLQYSATALVVACLLALPVATWLGHKRRFGAVAVNVANAGRAIPSVAFIFLAAIIFGISQIPVAGPIASFIALSALAIPPLVTNAYVAVAEVGDDVRDAAKGMGLSEWQVLSRVELPLAMPLIMAGVRTAAVQVVATASIVAVVGAGGLGRFIIDGYAVQDDVRVFAGALLVALLSLATEIVFAVLQRALTPKGLRAKEPVTAAVVPAVPTGEMA
ncbi:MAG: ABC transporter permease [Acidimicrobiales bacterium]